jgi:hypothetical protein
MSLASDIYNALYDLCIAAVNPGWSLSTDPLHASAPWTNGTIYQALPPVPVIQDQQSEGAPTTGVYLAIGGTPSLDRQGTPDIGVQGANDSRNLDQLYTGEAVLWEVNGDGAKIQTVFDFSETEAGQAALGSYGVSIMDYGVILDVAIKLDNRWVPQARASIIVSAKSRVSEILSTIAKVHWANAENPANSGSIEYPSP